MGTRTWFALLAGLAACDEPLRDSGIDWIDDGSEPDCLVQPGALAFGGVPLGEERLEALTIENAGEATLYLSSVEIQGTSEVFVVEDPPDIVLEPGERTWAAVRFAPTAVVPESATVAVVSDDPDQPLLQVPLSGEGLGGKLVLVLEEEDLGVLEVGCAASTSLGLRNDGTADLRVEALDLISTTDDLVFVEDESAGPLPWTLAPAESRVLGRFDFQPLQEGLASATLTVTSDAAEEPVQEATVSGSGLYGDYREQPVGIFATQVDAMVVVNGSASMQDEIDAFIAAYPVLHEALRAYATTYHLIAITQTHCVSGGTRYVDETFTPEEAAAAVAGMIAHAGEFTAVVAMLDIAVYHVVRPAECNTGSLRDFNHWSLIGFTDVADSSASDAAHYVSQTAGKKGDDDFTYNGIAGDSPSGCASAESWGLGHDAIALTGGSFMSICSSDFEADLVDFAGDLARNSHMETTYALDAEPVEATLQVLVNGAPMRGGWSYDPGRNAITFGELRDWDDTVVFAYATPGTCG